MCLSKWIKAWRKRRRDRIYEGPSAEGPSAEVDGGTRIRHDTDAPKEITSRELIRFSCRFSALSLAEEDTGLKCGVYRFDVSKGERGVNCTVRCSNPRVLPEGERKLTHTEDFLSKLEALVREYGVARYNGSYYKVSGLPDFYGAILDAEYASGETIYCYNNQDPFLPVGMIVALCRLFGIGQETEDT